MEISDVSRSVHHGKEHILAMVQLRQCAAHLLHLETQTSYAKFATVWSALVNQNYDITAGLEGGSASEVWAAEMEELKTDRRTSIGGPAKKHLLLKS